MASVVVVCNAAGVQTGRPLGAWGRGVRMLPAVWPAGRRARQSSARRRPGASESGGRHCTAGQYGYVPLGQHLVLRMNSRNMTSY